MPGHHAERSANTFARKALHAGRGSWFKPMWCSRLTRSMIMLCMLKEARTWQVGIILGVCHELECGYASDDLGRSQQVPILRRINRLSKVIRQGMADNHLTIERVKNVRFIDRAACSDGSRFGISQYCREEGQHSMYVMVCTRSHFHVFFFGVLIRPGKIILSFMTRSSTAETASDAT